MADNTVPLPVTLDLFAAPLRPDGRRTLKAGIPFYARVTYDGADTPAHLNLNDGTPMQPLNASTGSAMYRQPGNYTLRAVTGAGDIDVLVAVEGELAITVNNHRTVMTNADLEPFDDQGMDNTPGLCEDPAEPGKVHYFWAGAGIYQSEILHLVGTLEEPLAYGQVSKEPVTGNPYHDPYVYDEQGTVVSGGKLYLDAGPVVILNYPDLHPEPIAVMLTLWGQNDFTVTAAGATYGGLRFAWRLWSETSWHDAGPVLDHAINLTEWQQDYQSYLNTVNGGTSMMLLPDYGGTDYLLVFGPRAAGKVYGPKGDERNYNPCAAVRANAKLLLQHLLANNSIIGLWETRTNNQWMPQLAKRVNYDNLCPGGGYHATQFVWSTYLNRWLALWEDLHANNSFWLSWSDKLIDAKPEDWTPPKLLFDPNDTDWYGDCPYFLTTNGMVGQEFRIGYSTRPRIGSGWELREFTVKCL